MVSLHAELTAVLEAGGIPDAALEAQWILEDITDEEKAREIAKRRANHEPLQYLLGAWEFYGMKMLVGEGVLIPRSDTETLVDAVLQYLRGKQNAKIVDLCTGSGCIALALKAQRADCTVCGIDKSPQALAYARKNANLHHLDVPMLEADVCLPETAAAYANLDVIVSNPPYLTADDMNALQEEVTYEPKMALAGGENGLYFYQNITGCWRSSLRIGGCLAYEVGIHQADAVAEILREQAFENIEIIPDLCGIPRVVCGIYQPYVSRKE